MAHSKADQNISYWYYLQYMTEYHCTLKSSRKFEWWGASWLQTFLSTICHSKNPVECLFENFAVEEDDPPTSFRYDLELQTANLWLQSSTQMRC